MNNKNVVLSFGGNKNQTLDSFEKAIEELKEHIGEIIKKSSIYQSEAWGFEEETAPFLNQIIELKTFSSPEEILATIQNIETKLGRKAKTKKEYESRIIDIDILFYENEIINSKKLIIPHPLIQNRRFILMPLAEILSNFIHPIFQKSINQLLLQCEDDLEVKKL